MLLQQEDTSLLSLLNKFPTFPVPNFNVNKWLHQDDGLAISNATPRDHQEGNILYGSQLKLKN